MNLPVEKADTEVLVQHLRESYMEIFPAPDIERKVATLERNSYVAVTCSPSKGIDETLALTERLVAGGFRVVPHIAARNVRDRKHLGDIMATLAELRIESLFVPGGDRPQPMGEFRTALELLRAVNEFGHHFHYIGVAAHPEGHPEVDNETLLDQLAQKQRFANYMVTQMCFDASALAKWLNLIRGRGIDMPVWIGLPGVIERSRLLKTSVRIGVGASLRFLSRNTRAAAAMVRSAVYQPDGLLRNISPIAASPAYGVAGYHLFCFNQVETTAIWRARMIRTLT